MMRSFNQLAVVAWIVGSSSVAMASSHREAPGIAEDQYADNTDVYLFISPSDPDRVVMIANYVPLLSPASGPNFYRFSDDVLYSIRVDNDGDARPDVAYEFLFDTTVRDDTTFLYNVGQVNSVDDADLNVVQTYSVWRRALVNGRPGRATVIARDIPVAPWDVGQRSFPDYAAVANDVAARGSIDGNRRVFAGPRREAFQVDLNVFDLLGVGPRAAGLARANYATEFNVMSLVLEVPIADVAVNGTRPTASAPAGQRNIGVYATASRQQVSILRRNTRRSPRDSYGQWVQISRLAIPLVNEVLVPLGLKDDFNRTDPVDDGRFYGAGILNPQLNGLLRAVIPELGCVPTAASGNPTLLAVVQGLGARTVAADLLTLDISAGQTFTSNNPLGAPGFPNGRRIEDDVVATELNVICDGDGLGTGMSPAVAIAPNTDNISGPPVPRLAAFPYMPLPLRSN